MDDRQLKVTLFSKDPQKIRFWESFVLKHTDLNCSLDVCPFKISTEEILLHYTPNMILLDFAPEPTEEHDQLMAKLERIADMIPIVGIFHGSHLADALKYIKLGLRDYIEYPFKGDDSLLPLMHRFHRQMASKSGSGFSRIGKVYTFLNFKGGVGNTFVTVNSAVNMARLTKKRVLLWDMALQAGDIPFFLNVKTDVTLANIIGNLSQIDESYLSGILPPHETGVSILSAPSKIEDIERLTAENLEKTMNLFIGYFDHIFVDGGYRITEPLLPVIDASSYLFITSTLELISLRSASRCLELLEQLNYSPEKTKVIINRYNSKHEAITVDKAKEILKYSIVQFFANDYDGACQSVNLGQAIAEAAPKSPLNRQFTEFAEKIESRFNAVKKDKAVLKLFMRSLKGAMGHVAK